MSCLFISHSSHDDEQAKHLLSWLNVNGFTETFLDFDKDGIAPGADWERTLYREMTSAEAVIVILTQNWLDSKWCFAEFTQARALGKAIFPLIEVPTGQGRLSSDIQHLDLVKDREGGLARLAAELDKLVLNGHGGFHWDNTRPPYPGLLAFDEADAAVYFGRDDEVHRLVERLNARRAQGGSKLLVVLGASGSGKSSLLRAGALPRIRFDKNNWIALPPFRPQFHPLEALAQSLASSFGPVGDWRHWRDVLAAKDLTQALSDLARDLRATHGANDAQILITIDQAEELFGAADKAEAEDFLRVINAFLDERLPFLVVMALRSDYLGMLQQAPSLTAPSEEFSLKPMPLARLCDVIEGPARVGGFSVDNALVMAAMADAETDDVLPLLAFALREIYDRFGKSGRLTLEAYRALGDDAAQLSPIENAVRRKADEVLGAKPAAEGLEALKEAFVPAMVRVNTEGEYVRRSARLDALPAQARPLIEQLAKARLLIIQWNGDAAIVEVAHEALLRKWPLLRGWLDEEREFLIGKDQLEQDLRDWEEATLDQKNEALLSGLKLTRAETWLVGKPHQLSADERMFIKASTLHHQEEERRRRRLERWVLGGTVSFAVFLLVAIVVVSWKSRVAQTQEARADKNFLLAEGTMRSMLAAAQPRPGTVSEDLPQIVQLRKQLARNAEDLYVNLTKQKPGSETLGEEMAVGYEGLGDTNRLSENYRGAVKEYELGIAEFQSLAKRFPREPRYRQEMANSYDSMGLAYQSQDNASKDKDAANAYDEALHLQETLIHDSPENNQYRLELARTYNNRGILLYNTAHLAESESDYRSAIQLFEALVDQNSDLAALQEKARVYNNLGNVLKREAKFSDARINFEKAIKVDTELIAKDPINRDCKLELAIFKDNLAIFLQSEGNSSAASDSNRQALELIEDLIMPSSSLALPLAIGHNIRTQLLGSDQMPEAEKESQASMTILEKLKAAKEVGDTNEFSRTLTSLAYNYIRLAEMRQKSGALADARSNLKNVSILLPDVPEPDKSEISTRYDALVAKVSAGR